MGTGLRLRRITLRTGSATPSCSNHRLLLVRYEFMPDQVSIPEQILIRKERDLPGCGAPCGGPSGAGLWGVGWGYAVGMAGVGFAGSRFARGFALTRGSHCLRCGAGARRGPTPRHRVRRPGLVGERGLPAACGDGPLHAPSGRIGEPRSVGGRKKNDHPGARPPGGEAHGVGRGKAALLAWPNAMGSGLLGLACENPSPIARDSRPPARARGHVGGSPQAAGSPRFTKTPWVTYTVPWGHPRPKAGGE